MMIVRTKNKSLGFTLIELAIVLAVTGVLFAGLYRLLSGGNQQVKDTSVASQHVQLIDSVKAFLNSAKGQSWMAEYATTSAVNTPLSLPAVAPDGNGNAGCHGSFADTNLQAWCDALPTGFSSATTNAYGQSYTIQVQTGPKDASAPAGTAPSTYSFMIVTSGGDKILDADGGRISGQIGSDGGFIYSISSCGFQACGTYGGWSANVTGVPPGFGSAVTGITTSGHVASRTYVSPESFSTLPWLARSTMPSDQGSNTPTYNTMTVPLLFGAQQVYLGKDMSVTTGASSAAINLQGGAVNLQQGQIADSASNGQSIVLDAKDLVAGHAGVLTGNPFIVLSPRCTGTVGGINNISYAANCAAALQVNGDANVMGQFWAGVFIYQTNAGNSDIRLKKDIKPLPQSLDDIMRLKPVSYSFKSNGEKSLGFIAQDIEKLYPDLVIEGRDGMKAVKYDGLIAPLVSAVQQLKQENDDLRRQLLDQAKRQDKLEQAVKEKAN